MWVESISVFVVAIDYEDQNKKCNFFFIFKFKVKKQALLFYIRVNFVHIKTKTFLSVLLEKTLNNKYYLRIRYLSF